MPQPFEASSGELSSNIDEYIEAVYASLETSTLELPQGPNYVDYSSFNEGYEDLKSVTRAFRQVSPATLEAAVKRDSLSFLVIRAILGLTPPEWAALATADTGVAVSQGAARTFDQRAREDRSYFQNVRGAKSVERIDALLVSASLHLNAGVPERKTGVIHRLDKVDTADGLASLQLAADLNVPYAVLLYERYLGRPFAGHRDSISELVGDIMEAAVEKILAAGHISHRKTGRAERLPGFDQAPDFVIPDEHSTAVAIEAKIASDDGTARDKFTRLRHLVEISRLREAAGGKPFQVVACIDGRGFGVRREDMRKLILDLDGKVFTFKTLIHLIAYTDLSKYAVEVTPPITPAEALERIDPDSDAN